ncbi:hypothetical protein V5799_013286, partial [Amblyomma americanum]
SEKKRTSTAAAQELLTFCGWTAVGAQALRYGFTAAAQHLKSFLPTQTQDFEDLMRTISACHPAYLACSHWPQQPRSDCRDFFDDTRNNRYAFA